MYIYIIIVRMNFANLEFLCRPKTIIREQLSN